MVDDDRWIQQLSADRITMTQANTTIHSLITKERTQKLDLLMHLLSNLPQSLVICGPPGIGKTTLLTLLQERNTDLARYCLIHGNADLSFEAIQQKLTQTLAGKTDQSLSKTLEQYEGQHKQAILVIDNAGELVPGLISTIIHYAVAKPILRVIFALTHDELQVKRSSDKAIDDCHIVEIPTLSEKQCGDFLQHLSTKPELKLPFKAITENMIAHVYRETHGVPGRIIAELSSLPRIKKDRKMKKLPVYIVTVAVAVFCIQWLVLNKKVITPTFVQQKSETIEIAQPKPESQIMLTLPPAQSAYQSPEQQVPSNTKKTLELPLAELSEKPKQPVIAQFEEQIASDATALKLKPPTEPASTARNNQKLENKIPEDTSVKIAERNVAKQEKVKLEEMKAKPEESAKSSVNDFTMQLMVLSKQVSVDGILKKYPTLSPGIKIIKIVANGQEKFILEYGSYPNAISANKARLSLPAEFHNAMIRKIR